MLFELYLLVILFEKAKPVAISAFFEFNGRMLLVSANRLVVQALEAFICTL